MHHLDYHHITPETCRLQIHSEPYWRRAVSDGAIRAVSIDGIYVVFQAFGELMILIGGVDEADEHVLGEVMECFKHVATNVLDGVFEASAIQSPDKFSKLCVGIDEIFSQVFILRLFPTYLTYYVLLTS